MEFLQQMTATGGMDIVSGRIVNIGEDGKLKVKINSSGAKVTCDFLRTTGESLPELHLGSPVLCLLNDSTGYVLGIIQPYLPKAEEKKEPRALNLKATDSIELSCGECVLSFNKNGKVVLRGLDITTRASGKNKIKGTTISIN